MKSKQLCYSFFVTNSAAESDEIPTDESRWNLLQDRKQALMLREAFAVFRTSGIEPILIKGWAAGRMYPVSKFRSSTDIDLAVSPDEYERALDITGEMENHHLSIDLHKGLRHLDTVQWDDLSENSFTVDLDGIPIRVLRPEDHLRVLCVHWLADGGAYKQRLWDIYYAVENRSPGFDWERCLMTVSATRRRWIVCVIGLTHKYFNLNIDELPFSDEARDLPVWLTKALEREWASDVRLSPIHIYRRSPRDLFKQIRKRLPPNPIQSTVDMEGSFDSWTRTHYQLGSLFKRFGPSFSRVTRTLFRPKG